MCCVIMRSEHLSRSVSREVSCPCSLSPLLIWDCKGGNAWSLLQLLCPCFGTCHMYADRLDSKKGIALCSPLHLQLREMPLALKHWEALSLMNKFCFSRGCPGRVWCCATIVPAGSWWHWVALHVLLLNVVQELNSKTSSLTATDTRQVLW